MTRLGFVAMLLIGLLTGGSQMPESDRELAVEIVYRSRAVIRLIVDETRNLEVRGDTSLQLEVGDSGSPAAQTKIVAFSAWAESDGVRVAAWDPQLPEGDPVLATHQIRADSFERFSGLDEAGYPGVTVRAFYGRTELVTRGDGPQYTKLPVFYGTDRKATGSSDATAWYGSESGDLEVGYVQVSIPRDHLIGVIEAPGWWSVGESEDPEQHVLLLSVDPVPAARFAEMMSEVLSRGNRTAVVFIHGFNVTFEEAAQRAGQLAYDLQLHDAAAMYSWPSRGELMGYFEDAGAVRLTVSNLVRFLRLIAEEAGAERIQIIAHSMGNRALAEAVFEMPPALVELLNHVVLVAPDIDLEVFATRIAPRLVQLQRQVTVYTSETDKALQASEAGHDGGQRVGSAVWTIPGIDTIDASSVESSFPQSLLLRRCRLRACRPFLAAAKPPA